MPQGIQVAKRFCAGGPPSLERTSRSLDSSSQDATERGQTWSTRPRMSWLRGANGLESSAANERAGTGAERPMPRAIAVRASRGPIRRSLARRGRIQLNVPADEWFDIILNAPNVRLLELSRKIAVLAANLPDDIVRDPTDRLITATAIHHGVSLVTADRKIIAANLVATIW